MYILLFPFRVLWRLWFYLINSLYLIIFSIPCLFFILKDDYRSFYKIAVWWGYYNLFLMGFRLKFTSETYLKSNTSYIAVANHTSMLDIAAMIVTMKNNPIVFVGKKEVESYPLLGYIFKKTMISVDRSNTKSRKSVYASTKSKIEKGYSICLFPEGLVPEESVRMAPFKSGAFKIAIDTNLPMAAFTFNHFKKGFPFSWQNGMPTTLEVFAHPIIQTDNQLYENNRLFKEAVYRLIDSQLLED